VNPCVGQAYGGKGKEKGFKGLNLFQSFFFVLLPFGCVLDIFACKATSTLNILVFCLLKGSRLLANSVKANELGVLELCDDGLEYRTSDDVTSVRISFSLSCFLCLCFFFSLKKGMVGAHAA
jgi:hypothetical protein